MDSIAALPDRLEAAVRGLTEAQLDTPYRPGGWTVRQVVHHLADAHLQGFVRMKFLLTEDYPLLKPYVQDAWAATADAQSAPVEESLRILRGLHARWSALLGSLDEAAWTRRGFHPERGVVTADDLLRSYAAHCISHVESITALRREHNWGGSA
jgi:hypothetical protein